MRKHWILAESWLLQDSGLRWGRELNKRTACMSALSRFVAVVQEPFVGIADGFKLVLYLTWKAVEQNRGTCCYTACRGLPGQPNDPLTM
jgi:hypothetical protein